MATAHFICITFLFAQYNERQWPTYISVCRRRRRSNPSPYVECPLEHRTCRWTSILLSVWSSQLLLLGDANQAIGDQIHFSTSKIPSPANINQCVCVYVYICCGAVCVSLAAYHVTNEKRNKCPPAYTAWAHVQNQVKRLLITSCFVVSRKRTHTCREAFYYVKSTMLSKNDDDANNKMTHYHRPPWIIAVANENGERISTEKRKKKNRKERPWAQKSYVESATSVTDAAHSPQSTLYIIPHPFLINSSR